MRIRNRFNTLFPATKLNDINLDWIIARMKELWTEFQEWPRTPVIRNGNWWIWDDEQEDYIDSGTAATGPQGVPGPQGATGPQGDAGISIHYYRTSSDMPNARYVPIGTLAITEDAGIFGKWVLYEADGFAWFACGSLQGPQGQQGQQGPPGEVTQATLDAALVTKAPVIIDTAAGAVATFEDGADDMPIKKLVANIEAVQAGSGSPSPQNVRPITGWTEANIYRETAYDPDTSPIATIPFPLPTGTVYGGTLTINDDGTGELILKKVKLVFTGSEKWSVVQGNVFFLDSALPSSYAINAGNDWLCNKYLVVNGVANTNTMHDNRPDDSITNQPGAAGGTPRYNRVLVKDSTYSTVEDFKASLSTTNLEIIYSLPNPNTYSLTIAQINTLLGINNIWADCGEVSVDYPANTKLYIQKINAPTDDDMIADARIESGNYFIIGNNLYLSTSVIPAGDTIIPGTNCIKTDLAAALNALNT